ncbi:hypothetical protein ACLOJK_031434 [Asimina triloba]
MPRPLIASSPTAASTSLYQVLRVKETASPIEIDTAYRTLARSFQSDIRSDGRDLMEIRKAYEILSDPAARAAYDRSWRGGRVSIGRIARASGRGASRRR